MIKKETKINAKSNKVTKTLRAKDSKKESGIK